MDQMICTECVRHKTCKSNMLKSVGSDDPRLLVVLDQPSEFDDSCGTTFGGELKEFLEHVVSCIDGLEFDQLHFTYALKCRGDKATPKVLASCKSHLLDDIHRLNPSCILAMGEVSLNMLSDYKKISKYRGKTSSVEVIGARYNVVFTYSLSYVARVQSKLVELAKDIDKAYCMAYGIEQSHAVTKFYVCTTIDDVLKVADFCVETGICSFDFETVTIGTRGTFDPSFYATTLSITFQFGSGYVIPIEHFDSPFNKDEVVKIFEILDESIFSNPNVRKVAHNLNFDFHVLRLYGITRLAGRIDDTMLMHHLYDETDKHGLKHLVSTFFPEAAGYDDDVSGLDWSSIPLQTLAQYNAADTDYTLRLLYLLESKLLEDTRVYTIYRNLTMAAFRPLWEAEVRGMRVDRGFLLSAIDDLKNTVEEQELLLRNNKVVLRYEEAVRTSLVNAEIDIVSTKLDNWRASHRPGLKTEAKLVSKLSDLKSGVLSIYSGINFGSWQQLEKLLYYHEAGFSFHTIGGGTSKDIIVDLPDDTGFVSNLLLLRSLKKILSTYLIGIRDRLDDNDCVHTTFKLHGTVSGRLSSANPNLQNLPNIAKLKDDKAIYAVGLVKSCFVPPNNHHIVQLDYSQAELRIIADFANESNMLDAYLNDKDLHSQGAAHMLGISYEDFMDLTKTERKEPRTRTKARNFGLIYGMGASGFQDYAKNNFGIILTEEEAEHERDSFFELYPGLLDYHELYKEKARNFGWVRTLYGRRRRLPNIHSDEDYKLSMDERAAINSPIQGTAGEFTLFAIALLYRRLDPRVLFVNTVHDSIIFYIPDDILIQSISDIAYTMENLPNELYFNTNLNKLSMKVDAEVSAKSWKDLEEVSIK